MWQVDLGHLGQEFQLSPKATATTTATPATTTSRGISAMISIAKGADIGFRKPPAMKTERGVVGPVDTESFFDRKPPARTRLDTLRDLLAQVMDNVALAKGALERAEEQWKAEVDDHKRKTKQDVASAQAAIDKAQGHVDDPATFYTGYASFDAENRTAAKMILQKKLDDADRALEGVETRAAAFLSDMEARIKVQRADLTKRLNAALDEVKKIQKMIVEEESKVGPPPKSIPDVGQDQQLLLEEEDKSGEDEKKGLPWSWIIGGGVAVIGLGLLFVKRR